MLEATYIHIPGVGYATERAIHRCNLVTWRQFMLSPPPLPPRKLAHIMEHLPNSFAALKKGDLNFFADSLPSAEHWRLLTVFKHRAVCLDIETSSQHPSFTTLTVVGLYDWNSYRVFVTGIDMDDMPKVLDRYDIIVTYNGKRFDIPFLIRCGLRNLRHKIHIDLMHICHRLNIRGGLKGAERRMGIKRPAEIAGLSGYDAVLLWQRYISGEKKALNRLIDYNRCDTVNLAALFDALLPRLINEMRGQRE